MRYALAREAKVYRNGVSGLAYIIPNTFGAPLCLLSFPFGSSCGSVISVAGPAGAGHTNHSLSLQEDGP